MGIAEVFRHARTSNAGSVLSETGDEGSLKRSSSIAGAVAWTGAAMWSLQLSTWICNLLVARLLVPSDYGLIGLSNVFLGLVTHFSELGLGAAVIVMPTLNRDHVAQINTVSILSGAGLFAISCASAVPLGLFFRAPRLPAVLTVMSLAFLITSFKIVPDALLQREFRFNDLAKIQTAQAIAYAGATVIAAAFGAGYWSLVIGPVTGALVATTSALFLRRHYFSLPRLGAIGDSLAFGRHVMFTRLSWYFYSNSDFMVAGRMLGQAALGSYTVAWTIANLPVQRLSAVVTKVLPPFFCEAQADKEKLRRYVLTINSGLSLITLPASLGLSYLANDIVMVVLGPKWSAAVLPLRILALYTCVRSVTTWLGPLLNASGHNRFAMRVNVAAAIYFPVGFYFASRWGTVGIALAWPILYPIVAIPLYRKALARIDLSLSQYIACLWPAVGGTLCMAACLAMVRSAIPPDAVHPSLRLVIDILVGIVSYSLWMTTFHRILLRQVVALLRTPS